MSTLLTPFSYKSNALQQREHRLVGKNATRYTPIFQPAKTTTRPKHADTFKIQASAAQRNEGKVWNPVPHHEVDQFLRQVKPYATAMSDSLTGKGHRENLKQLILIGDQLIRDLNLSGRMPETSTDKVHHIRPTELIVYRQGPAKMVVSDPDTKAKLEYETTPQILATILDPKPKPWHGPIRWIANLTGSLAKDAPLFSSDRVANAFFQLMAGMSELPEKNPVTALQKLATTLENVFHNLTQLDFTPAEREQLKETAFGYGYQDDLPAYVKQVFLMQQGIQMALHQANPHAKGPLPDNLKVGITYKDEAGNRVIKDMTSLFPGCDLEAFQEPLDRDRQKLDRLFSKK